MKDQQHPQENISEQDEGSRVSLRRSQEDQRASSSWLSKSRRITANAEDDDGGNQNGAKQRHKDEPKRWKRIQVLLHDLVVASDDENDVTIDKSLPDEQEDPAGGALVKAIESHIRRLDQHAANNSGTVPQEKSSKPATATISSLHQEGELLRQRVFDVVSSYEKHDPKEVIGLVDLDAFWAGTARLLLWSWVKTGCSCWAVNLVIALLCTKVALQCLRGITYCPKETTSAFIGYAVGNFFLAIAHVLLILQEQERINDETRWTLVRYGLDFLTAMDVTTGIQSLVNDYLALLPSTIESSSLPLKPTNSCSWIWNGARALSNPDFIGKAFRVSGRLLAFHSSPAPRLILAGAILNDWGHAIVVFVDNFGRSKTAKTRWAVEQLKEELGGGERRGYWTRWDTYMTLLSVWINRQLNNLYQHAWVLCSSISSWQEKDDSFDDTVGVTDHPCTFEV